MSNTRVLIVGAECAPFAKTGGLADVIGTLPTELAKTGLDVRVMLPEHGIIKHEYGKELTHLKSFYIHLGWRTQYVGIDMLERDGVTYYFIDNEYYFYNAIYKGGDDEGEQYAYFSRAVIESLQYLDFTPDVIHVNDWHTAMIPMLLKTQYYGRRESLVKTVLTIHNLQYQGEFSFEFVKHMLGVEDRYLTPEYMEAYGVANFLKAGIVFADKITTVSPTYAREIQDQYYGKGLDGLLRARSADLTGIVNGISYTEYDPATDDLIARNYSVKDVSGKAVCRAELIERFSLGAGEDTCIIGMVTRLTEQKGLDLIRRVLPELLEDDICFVLLGSGDADYQNYFNYVAANYYGKAGIYIGYRNSIAHRIYAGSDLFLMPSMFEPCGISQMIAQRYGTLPVVRETGGLADTVTPYNKYTGEGDGFSFANYNAHEMMAVIREAAQTLKDSGAKARLMKNAMTKDNSFVRSAQKYAELFFALAER